PRHALLGFDDEHAALDERQLEIFGEHREVVRLEFLLRVQRETIEVFDRRQNLLSRDPPVVVDALDVELPRRDSRAIPELHESVDGERVSVPWQRPGEILTIALLNDDTRGAGAEFRGRKIRGAVLIR